MKMTGVLVQPLINENPKDQSGHVACENVKPTLHVVVLRATHGMLTSASPWHRKFKVDSEEHGLKFDP